MVRVERFSSRCGGVFSQNKASSKNLCATLGMFDGLHLGHQGVFAEVVRVARELRGEATLITFYPHPGEVVAKREGRTVSIPRLSTLHHLVTLADSHGIQRIILVHFTRELSEVSGSQFVQEVLIDRLGVSFLVIGEDAGLGRGRDINATALVETMRDQGAAGVIVPSLLVDGQKLGSRLIRSALSHGDVAGAASGLGRAYTLRGRVVHGDGRGRRIGFPTANLSGMRQILPARGVYSGSAEVGGVVYPAMINVGVRPTFGGDQSDSVEVNFIDYPSRASCYGEWIEVSFRRRIRDEMRFASVEDLRLRLEQDRVQARSDYSS